MKAKSYLFRFTTHNLQQLRMEGLINMAELGRRAGIHPKRLRGYLYLRGREGVEMGRHPYYGERIKNALREHVEMVESVIGSGSRILSPDKRNLLRQWGLFKWKRLRRDLPANEPPRVLVCHARFVRWLIGDIPDLPEDILRDQKRYIKRRNEGEKTTFG